MINIGHNKKLYILSRLIFRWSLVYFLVLLFFEDIKRAIVMSHFSPHWLLIPMALSGFILLLGTDSKSDHITKEKVSKKEYIIALIFALLSGILVVIRLDSILFGLGFGTFICLIVFYVAIYLVKNN